MNAWISRRGLLIGFAACLPLQALAEEEHSGPPKPTFLPLGEFTINLHGTDLRFDFVVVSITLEVVPAAVATLKDLMPRLKETVMLRLMAMAEDGSLLPGHVDTVVLKTILADTLQKANPDSIREVLITRILYG